MSNLKPEGISNLKPEGIPNPGTCPTIKTQECIDDFFDARVAILIASMFGFIVAIAFNDFMVTLLAHYFDEDSILVKFIYLVSIFIFAIVIIYLLIKYMLPDRACNKWMVSSK